MKGDFTRWTFDPRNAFTRVLHQQGRVQLDADWNEQTAILLHTLRTLAEDLIGPYGVPPDPDGTPGEGFRLAPRFGKDGQPMKNSYRLLPGRYYVGGILVENREERVEAAPGGLLPDLPAGRHLLYLDVWEQLVTYVQHDLLREVALGGVDTTARARVAWQVRAQEVAEDRLTCRQVRRSWANRVRQWQPENRGLLKARAQAPEDRQDDDLCLAAPEARYTGENQLYRVEVHQGGTAAGGATFKWSRENGSVVFPVAGIQERDRTVTLEHLGRDGRFGLQKGSWVELLDDDGELREPVTPLLKVLDVDSDRSRVRLDGTFPAVDAAKHRYLRRWDHAERKGLTLEKGALRIEEGGWVELESGVQVRFEAAAEGGEAHLYRTGDHWLIPARTATADVEWPGPFDNPDALPPHGVEHRYAPLGLVTVADGAMTFEDCRRTFGAYAQSLHTGRADWQVFDVTGALVPAVVIEDLIPGWSNALSPARWISAKPDTRAPRGITTFQLAFNLEPDQRDLSLSLRIFADNAAVVTLNGAEIGRHERTGNKGFTGTPSWIEVEGRPLIEGDNTLTVQVTNASEGPMGLVVAGRAGSEHGCC